MKKIAAIALVAISLTACNPAPKEEAPKPEVTKSAVKATAKATEKATKAPKEEVKAVEAPEEVAPVIEAPVEVTPTIEAPVEVAPIETVAPVDPATIPVIPVTPVEEVAPVAPEVIAPPVAQVEVAQPEVVAPEVVKPVEVTAPEIETPDYIDHGNVANNWATQQLAAWGLGGAVVEMRETTSLCGVVGGCSYVGTGLIYMDPAVPSDISGQHVLAHEYAHAVLGFTGGFTMTGECGAEAYARSVTGVDHFSYPAQCGEMVRAAGK